MNAHWRNQGFERHGINKSSPVARGNAASNYDMHSRTGGIESNSEATFSQQHIALLSYLPTVANQVLENQSEILLNEATTELVRRQHYFGAYSSVAN